MGPGAHRAVALAPATALIVAADTFGNRRWAGGDKFRATLTHADDAKYAIVVGGAGVCMVRGSPGVAAGIGTGAECVRGRTAVPATIADQGTGQYSLAYTAPRRGTYKVGGARASPRDAARIGAPPSHQNPAQLF